MWTRRVDARCMDVNGRYRKLSLVFEFAEVTFSGEGILH